MADRADLVADFVRNLFPGGTLEVAEDPNKQKQKYLESTGGSEELVSDAVDGLNVALGGKKPTQKQLEGLEAIILKDLCPTLEINEDQFVPPKGRWARLANDQGWLKEVIRAAGRVDCASIPTPYAGSGLLVAPDVVMTNRHVARLFAEGTGLEGSLQPVYNADFDFKREKQRPFFGEPTPVEKVLLIHPYWDVALLRLKSASERKPVKLATTAPTKLVEQEIAVIGYPFFRFTGSDYERGVLLDNFGDTPGYKRLQPGSLSGLLPYKSERERWPEVRALTHNASTLGGNSGSQVVHLDSHQVLAIHFAGAPFVTNWAVPTWELYRDSRVRDLIKDFGGPSAPPPPPADPEVEKAWAALSPRSSTVTVPGTVHRETTGTGEGEPPKPDVSTGASAGGGATAVVKIDVPLEITVRVLSPVIGGAPATTSPAPAASAPRTEAALEGINVDPDYDNRPGYDPDHLDVSVPLPTLTAEAMALVARDRTRQGAEDDHLLHYHHFSLAVNKRRRLAFFTACNTTRDPALFGSKSRASLSGGDTWILDPRIAAAQQITTKDLYGPSPFDRGHIVRREDAYWGMTDGEREAGNFDTFHYTNCSPQDPAYNQSSKRGLWGQLENRIGEQSRAKGLRMSLFAGPVLGQRDPVLWGVRVPLQFWKVVLCVDDASGKLKAFAFLLSQAKLVGAVKEEATFDPGDLKAYQVSIARIEQLTSVRFDEVVKSADVRKKGGGGGEESIELASLESVKME